MEKVSSTVDEQLTINGINNHHKEKNSHRILVVGCGSVGRCTLPLLHELLVGDLKPRSITVLDCATPPLSILDWLKKVNIPFEHKCIEEDSYADLLSEYLSAGDVLVDLAFSVSTKALVKWCNQHQVLYVNTTCDVWGTTAKGDNIFETYPFELYDWHQELLEVQDELNSKDATKGATAVVEHGANPGLVSHFVKRGLQDMARHALQHGLIKDAKRQEKLENALNTKNYAQIAYLLGVKTIHISERDSQATNIPRKKNEILNTWSTISLCEESTCYAQFAWGTHEQQLPKGAVIDGEKTHKWPPQRICLLNKGMNILIRSWVPSGPIIGMADGHPESFSIAQYLTIREENSDKLLYQPSVYFVYLPCDSAVCSLNEWRMQGYPPLNDQRILCDDIIFGADELGVLILGGHEIPAWWTGSILDIGEARRLVEGNSATTLQVAISVVAGVIYALRHPQEGVCFPEQIDSEQILSMSIPFLGNWVSQAVPWTVIPSSQKDTNKETEINGKHIDNDCRWLFDAFKVDLRNL